MSNSHNPGLFSSLVLKSDLLSDLIDQKLEDDDATLSSCNGLVDGSTLVLVVLHRFVLYVTGLDGETHEIEIPFSIPKVSALPDVFNFFDFECYAHKEGPVIRLTGLMAFNHPFYTPILSQPSIPHSSSLLPPCAISPTKIIANK